MPPSNHTQKPDLFRFLPSEIVIDILSRLPIRTIVVCKSVCRSWHSLLRTRDFADSHLPKSVPGLVIFGYGSKSLKFFEFDDDLGLEHHDLHYKPLTRIDPMEFTVFSVLQGSVNGLLLLRRKFSQLSEALYICNTITREYIELLVHFSSPLLAYGFGVSKMTGHYKIVRIYLDFHCSVYVLGTGMWRSIGPVTKFGMYDYFSVSVAVSLNGNLHWMVKDVNRIHYISWFDLEAETFSRFSLPPLIMERSFLGLVALGDCLCVCDNAVEVIDIWLMKEYGDEKSWNKEFVIRIGPDLYVRPYEIVRPIKVFRDGDILMALSNFRMIYYSNKTKTTKEISQFVDNKSDPHGMKALIHTPSFFSLDRFTNEKVSRF